MGESKYKSLNKDNDFEAARPLAENKLEALQKIAESKGIKVKTV